MGANESRPGGGNTHDSTGSHPTADDSEDLYKILEVTTDATAEEIKKSFRKLALIHHPDKNYDNVAEATQRFAKIQQAYEILSDEDERAFYDRHRDELLHRDADDDHDFDPTNLKSPKTTRASSRPGITTKQLLKFFDTTLWKGDFTDSQSSFFTIYRNLFHVLAVEEKSARDDSTIIFPSFGTSESSYDTDKNGVAAIKYFYSSWINFSTHKTFEWIEPHRYNQQTDRRLKRLIEKENQRSRENAKREYNETLRSLVSFIKKRDPRFSASSASNPDKWRAQEIQRIKRGLKDVAEKRAKEREEEARQYREQAWQRQQTDQSATIEEDEIHTPDETTDEQEELEPVNDWYCAACGKDFNSQGAWDNHERSKKHRQNAQRLKKQMLKEDNDLSLSQPISPPLSSAQPSQGQLSPDGAVSEGETSEIDVALQIGVEESLESLRLEETRDGSEPEPAETNTITSSAQSASSSQRASVNQTNDSEPEIEAIGMVRKRGRKNRPPIQLDPERDDFEQDSRQNVGPVENLKQEKTKREKRRAKAALKKQEDKTFTCNVCQEGFESKTKLFEHIKSLGHAQASPEPNVDSKESKKKGRR